MRVPFSSYLMPRGRAAAKEFGSFTTERTEFTEGERGSDFVKIVSLCLFLCVLCDLRGESSEKFSHAPQIINERYEAPDSIIG